VVLKYAQVAGYTYNWTVPQGWTFTGQGTNKITVTATTAGGNITVTATNKCFTSDVTTKAVSISAPPVAPGAIQDNSNVCDGLAYSIAPVTGAASYSWSVPAGFTIVSGQGSTSIKVKADNATATGNVTVVAINATGCTGAATSAAINKELVNGELTFPKAFSPNNDGIHDTWEITNLEKFPVNEVTIFNRWGAEVYMKKGYQNDWNGNNLEKGTYFYKVRVTMCDGKEKEYTGYTTIFR
jgi:gliding motility-associated-like protein